MWKETLLLSPINLQRIAMIRGDMHPLVYRMNEYLEDKKLDYGLYITICFLPSGVNM